MSYATYIQTTTTRYDTGDTPQNINVQTTYNGDVLIAIVRSAGVNVTSLAEFTQIASGTSGAYVFKKVCTTEEVAHTVEMVLASSTRSVVDVLQFSNVDTVYVTASSSTATPAALNPAGVDTKDFVMLAITTNAQTYAADIAVTASPSGYGAVDYDYTTNLNGTVAHVGYGMRSAAVESETPGAFTWTGTPTSIRSFLVMLSGLVNISITETTKLQDAKPFTITGTGFNAAIGDGTVIISSSSTDPAHVSAETQTIVDVADWSDTSIVVDSVTMPGDLSAGDTAYVYVTNSDSEQTAGFPVLVADPTLRLSGVIRDIDSNGLITLDPIEVVVLTGAAGSRTVELNVTTEASASGVIDIDNALYSINELTDAKLVVAIGSSTRASIPVPATVIDRND